MRQRSDQSQFGLHSEFQAVLGLQENPIWKKQKKKEAQIKSFLNFPKKVYQVWLVKPFALKCAIMCSYVLMSYDTSAY